MNKTHIIDNINKIKDNIVQACEKSNAGMTDIHIMAVTKTFNYEVVEPVIEAGITLFGENRVQEAMDKYPSPNMRDFCLHMIGHLQGNKAKKAMDFFDLIQSVDSFDIAKKINDYAEQAEIIYPALIEINVGNEENKSGFSLHAISELPELFDGLKNIEVQGIMAVPPLYDDPEKSRPSFVKMREIYDYLGSKYPFDGKFKYLSMGMSNDYTIAVEEGANLVRLGSAIFGSRV